MAKKIFDLIGIGIGPFNLGLAALASDIENISCIFFDQQKEFNWHPGLLLNNARLQVPFLADLVTPVNPRSEFSYLNFIHAKKRMIRFGIHENYFITRKEYNEYCKWVISQLDNLHFDLRCEAIHFDNDKKIYRVFIKEIATDKIKCFYGKHIVIGIGTIPNIPTFIKNLKHSHLLHSSDYLFHKEQILNRKSVAIIGSGQSAAEIFYDLLQHEQNFESLNWFTRSERFYPMDYSKFALEMTSPDYIDYFYDLPPAKKKEVLQKQNTLFKGINFSLIGEISEALHNLNMDAPKENIHLMANAELKNIITNQLGGFNLAFYHREKQQDFDYTTETIILATGYKYVVPDFLQSVKELIKWNDEGLYDVNRNYSIDSNNSIFVQNADLHSHGFNSADLGLGPYRNAIILNSILGKEHFAIEKNIAFQTFGIPI
jgi:putrescine N-hydroxylase